MNNSSCEKQQQQVLPGHGSAKILEALGDSNTTDAG